MTLWFVLRPGWLWAADHRPPSSPSLRRPNAPDQEAFGYPKGGKGASRRSRSSSPARQTASRGSRGSPTPRSSWSAPRRSEQVAPSRPSRAQGDPARRPDRPCRRPEIGRSRSHGGADRAGHLGLRTRSCPRRWRGIFDVALLPQRPTARVTIKSGSLAAGSAGAAPSPARSSGQVVTFSRPRAAKDRSGCNPAWRPARQQQRRRSCSTST
jgi:hypothetical protein